ncbi:MmcB family DNA repair protein [Fodinicurvata sp. EGI_FJ10296]|uniref:MmcB family DNA repair protein n=1 Tax=Fodinicurvata sp. EGI_FJ10296 TaxID=3231908 RepID=UPI0034527F32
MREQNKYTEPGAQRDNCREASAVPDGRPATTTALTRGIRRYLVACGGATVTELRLASGRRADIACIDARGIVTIVEIKSGPEDLKADSKWQTYLDYCDRFYFGVSPSFPLTLLPEEAGIILGDAYEAVVHRDCTPSPLAPARRKAMMIRFAQTAATRLMRVEDPTDPTTGSLADAIPSIPSRL